MRELSVGVVFSARPWRAELQRYVRDHVVGVALRLVRDPRVGMDEDIDAMVVDDEASFLTPTYVAALRARAVRVVGVYDPAASDDAGRVYLERLGVDLVLPLGCGPEELVAALRTVVPEAGVDQRFGELVAGLDLDVDPRSAGTVVAVGGPAGAGATEVAVALAAAVAERRSVVLVDVDEVNPGVARRLGLSLHPHLLDALDAVHHVPEPGAEGADPLLDALARPALAAAERLAFDVVVGLANREDWALARGGDVAALLDALRARWAAVVVNLGPHLEDLSRWVDRFGASRGALGVADAVVGVCEASPRGLLRFLDWLAEASPLVPSRPVHALVNRVPRSPFKAAEVVERLRTDAGGRLASVNLAPEDPAVRTAEWAAELVGGRRFRRAVAALEERIFAPAPEPVASGGTP
ncbi:MAG: hypothetical protein M3Q48_18075 [Actinomycetota bacterium]|nr:hypothetical protein [Actinomycetota bacterium]